MCNNNDAEPPAFSSRVLHILYAMPQYNSRTNTHGHLPVSCARSYRGTTATTSATAAPAARRAAQRVDQLQLLRRRRRIGTTTAKTRRHHKRVLHLLHLKLDGGVASRHADSVQPQTRHRVTELAHVCLQCLHADE